MNADIGQRVVTILQHYGMRLDAIKHRMSSILKAVPWQLRPGSEMYDDIYDLMYLALELKCPNTRCIVGDIVVDETFRNIFLNGIKEHINGVLNQRISRNYDYLSDFCGDLLVKELEKIEKDECPDTAVIGISNLLEERIDYRLCRSGQKYGSIPKAEFKNMVQEEYQYLLEHPEEYTEWYTTEFRKKAVDPYQDAGLLDYCNTFLESPQITGGKKEEYIKQLKQHWAYILGQATVSDILEEYYTMIDTLIEVEEDNFEVLREDAIKHLPYPMDSPEYQYVKRLFNAYHEEFFEPWANIDNGQIISIAMPKPSLKKAPLWGDHTEPRDLKYIVSQYLFFCLTLSFFPKAEEKEGIIRIGAIIYDLLCVFGYRENTFSEEDDYNDKVLQKEKYDLVRRYIKMDKNTGMYQRVI